MPVDITNELGPDKIHQDPKNPQLITDINAANELGFMDQARLQREAELNGELSNQEKLNIKNMEAMVIKYPHAFDISLIDGVEVAVLKPIPEEFSKDNFDKVMGEGSGQLREKLSNLDKSIKNAGFALSKDGATLIFDIQNPRPEQLSNIFNQLREAPVGENGWRTSSAASNRSEGLVYWAKSSPQTAESISARFQISDKMNAALETQNSKTADNVADIF